MSASAAPAKSQGGKTHEEQETERLLRVIGERVRSDEDTRAIIALVQHQKNVEHLNALGFTAAYTTIQGTEALENRFFPGIRSMTLMVETARVVLEKLQDEVRETMRRLQPPPHEKPLTVIHCSGKYSFDEMLSGLIRITGDLDQVGALLLDYAVRSDSNLFKQAVTLYNKLKDYSEIADQNRVAAVNCAKEYEIPRGNGATHLALAA